MRIKRFYSITIIAFLTSNKIKTTCGDTMGKSLNWVVIRSEKELEVTTLVTSLKTEQPLSLQSLFEYTLCQFDLKTSKCCHDYVVHVKRTQKKLSLEKVTSDYSTTSTFEETFVSYQKEIITIIAPSRVCFDLDFMQTGSKILLSIHCTSFQTHLGCMEFLECIGTAVGLMDCENGKIYSCF